MVLKFLPSSGYEFNYRLPHSSNIVKFQGGVVRWFGGLGYGIKELIVIRYKVRISLILYNKLTN